ncbi:MAG TPA: M55 family metallopeptidase [Gemmatimonadales bacterium]|nr:M55 family metallopeptidase [Gemmatimonadales bacterium]
MRTLLALSLLALSQAPAASAQAKPLKIFISVDMEGIGGIGTPAMTSTTGKDYGTGRELMTAEVNAVVEAILAAGPADIVVNDSHGDHQNLLHLKLDPRVQYIQGALKPYGMVQGLDSTYDGLVLLGVHAMAGTGGAFLAHTGSGAVAGLWLNGTEVGEGGLNSYMGGALGVPLLMIAGDSAATIELQKLVPGVRTVSTKVAIGSSAARMLHPDVVRARLKTTIGEALANRASAKPLRITPPVTIRFQSDQTTRADILEAIPGVKRIDGTTIEYQARTMREAYAMVRLMYRYVNW